MKTLKKVSKLQQQITLSIPLLCALQSASALGLGDISVNSSLNQPLSVSVPIFLSPGENVASDQIIAGLANPAEHNRAGLPYASILKDLSFNITRAPGGQLVLNINSQRSLYEPIINFLVDVNWGKGHLVKEVSIFLDPPNYQPVTRAAPAPVVSRTAPVAVTRQTLESSVSTRVAPPVTTRERRRPVNRKPIVIEDGSYTVQRGDSLSRIAKVVSKQSGFSMQEAMEVIYESNPEAFMGSMDRLRADVELIIPDLTVVTETVTETVAPTAAPPVSDTKPEPIQAPEVVAAPTDTPRLEILPPEEMTTVTETTSVATETVDSKTIAPSSSPDSPNAAMEQQIANAQVLEMQSQLAEIEGENSKLQIALDDTKNELEATHNALAEMREEMKSLVELQKTQVASGPVPAKSWIDWIPWMLTALAFGLLALFGFRRSQPQPALAEIGYTSAPSPREIASMAEAEIDHPDTSIGQVQPEARSLLDDYASIDDQTMLGDDTLLSEDDSTQVVPPTALMEAELASEESASELDSVQEAEIYLAYNQYSLAEKTINRLLNDDPDNHVYKLLKLRLLAETGKMNEMQSLSVDLFRQFPDRLDETHQKIQSICDKAFTSTDTSDTVTTGMLSPTAQTEIIELPESSDPTSETVLHEDMTDFMTDVTTADTQPAMDLEQESFISEALEADTISVEDEDLTLPEYKKASDDINFIAEDLTEEGLDLPFDLETEILEEEARRMASDRKDRDKKDS